MGTAIANVPTVAAKILVGWLERDQAVKFLREDCVFPKQLEEDEAEEMWRIRRDRVEALPARAANAPTELPMDAAEQAAANAFMRVMGTGGSVRRVIKIDPCDLVTYQPHITIDQVNKYAPHALSAADYAAKSLAVAGPMANLPLRVAPNMVDVDVPHGEFGFTFNPMAGGFQIHEFARHVSVTAFQNRMLLWAGYHRSYARIATAKPDGTDRSLLVALTTDADFFVSPQSPNQGVRAMVCGLRPSLLRDFFDDDFFMAVNLKRKRYTLQIRANCVPIDDV